MAKILKSENLPNNNPSAQDKASDMMPSNDFKNNIFQRCLFGALTGASDGVPSYSGGTTLSILNFYDKLIFNTKQAFNFKSRNWWRHLLWIIPFFVFWAAALIGFSFLTELIASSGLTIELMFFFITLSIAAVFIFWFSNKPKFLIKKTDFKKNRRNLIPLICFIVGFLIMLVIGIVTCVFGGINLDGAAADEPVPIGKIYIIMLGAFLSGFVWLMPGISGSLVLFFMGIYKDIYWTTLQHLGENLFIAATFVIFVIIGVACNILMSSYLLKNKRNEYFSFCFGLLVASSIAMLLAIPPELWVAVSSNLMHIVYIFISIFLALALILLVFKYWEYSTAKNKRRN